MSTGIMKIFAVVLTVLMILFLFCPVRTEADEHIDMAPAIVEVVEQTSDAPKEIPHVVLEPVEPYYIPNDDCYFLTWAYDRTGKAVELSQDEFNLLCRTVFCESGNQSFDCQKLTAIVILMRLISDEFPDTLHDVIYQDDGKQFNVVRRSDFDTVEVPISTENAVYEAIATYNEEPLDLFFFRANYFFAGRPQYKNMGDVYFSRR